MTAPDSAEMPAIGSIFEAGVTPEELRYLFGEPISEAEYDEQREELPHRIDAVGLYTLFGLRGDEATAARYLALMDEETRAPFLMTDWLPEGPPPEPVSEGAADESPCTAG